MQESMKDQNEQNHGSDDIQEKVVRIFVHLPKNTMRVYFVYDFFWFCMEGEESGMDLGTDISNVRARGKFVEKKKAQAEIPTAFQSLIANKTCIFDVRD